MSAPRDTDELAAVDNGLILDLFAGPGGWSEGLRMLGLSDVGIEWDAAACQTRAAAGHLTIRADVAQYPTGPFEGRVTGLIASPPCQDFSLAGKQAGRTGDKGQLIDTVPMWVEALRPRWVACEQVPPALPIWHEFACLFADLGYSTWSGVLNAADFGVPQTRRRAFLIASLDRPALPPEPTHARTPEPSLFGTQRPWVSMAEALGWGMTERPSTTLMAGQSRQGGAAPLDGGSGARETLRRAQSTGAWVVRTGANSMVTGRTGSRAGDGDVQPYERSIHEPAPTLDSKVGGAWKIEQAWAFDRPSTTIVGSFSPETVAAPGYRKAGDPPRQDTPGSIKITLSEALTLQSFPVDYPVQGSKTKQFEQVGNAVPPLLAAHVIGALTGCGQPAEVAA